YLQRKDSIAFGSKPNQLVLIGARKTLGSSIAAITVFLENVIARLRRSQRADESVVNDIDDTAEVREELADAALLSEREGDNGINASAEESAVETIDPVKLDSEIAELEGYVQLARSIGPSSKGNMLLRRLPDVLD